MLLYLYVSCLCSSSSSPDLHLPPWRVSDPRSSHLLSEVLVLVLVLVPVRPAGLRGTTSRRSSGPPGDKDGPVRGGWRTPAASKRVLTPADVTALRSGPTAEPCRTGSWWFRTGSRLCCRRQQTHPPQTAAVSEAATSLRRFHWWREAPPTLRRHTYTNTNKLHKITQTTSRRFKINKNGFLEKRTSTKQQK